jgi:hypothetical protein
VSESTDDHYSPDWVNPETSFGDADAVEKTTYVVGKGTDPNALSPRNGPPEVGRSGIPSVLWSVLVLIVLGAVVYLIGIIGT